MDEFVRGTTSIIEITVDDDIRTSGNIEMWINTFNEVIRHERDDLTYVRFVDGVTKVGYKLTQKESLSCTEDYISVQLRWTSDTGNVEATKKKYMVINDADWDGRIGLEPDYDDDPTYEEITRITENEILNMIRTQDSQ